MKKLSLQLVILFAIGLSIYAQKDSTDKDAVKNIIQEAYIDGLINEGNFEKIDKGFHPEFNLLGMNEEGEMRVLPIEEWKTNVKKNLEEGKLPRTGEEKVSIKFLMVDITGNAAIAKIEFYVGKKLTYVDYLSLYKFGEDWKIVNKIYYKIPD